MPDISANDAKKIQSDLYSFNGNEEDDRQIVSDSGIEDIDRDFDGQEDPARFYRKVRTFAFKKRKHPNNTVVAHWRDEKAERLHKKLKMDKLRQ